MYGEEWFREGIGVWESEGEGWRNERKRGVRLYGRIIVCSPKQFKISGKDVRAVKLSSGRL